VNAEQASKQGDAEAGTALLSRRPTADWEVSNKRTGLFPPEYWHVWKMREVATREALMMVWHAPSWQFARMRLGHEGGGEACRTGEVG